MWLPLFEPTGAESAGDPIPAPQRPAPRPPASEERFEHRSVLSGIGRSAIGRRLLVNPLSLTVDGRYEARLKQSLDALARIAAATVYPGRSILCVVGEGIRNAPGVAGEVFGVMAKEGINVELISQGASEINVTFVVREEDAGEAVRRLHAALVESAA